ncbi:MAG: DEAD/DEAH box helicase [Candidatus Pacebacteria bacterium]|nr:DEAD/DEAH box helicase [Candidatus Paceibacterota bacterium]
MPGFLRIFKRRVLRGSDSRTEKHPPVAERLARKSDFRELPIDDRILSAIGGLGFVHCTPVQKQTLPTALAGRDVTAMAQTGTGKTAAFLITIIQRTLNGDRGPRHAGTPMGLVLAPTRELAVQIGRDADELSEGTDFRHLVVYGGLGYKEQAHALEHPVDLVVATPGRLMDYMGKRIVDLSQVEILVIDEADRMLDMGFIPDVRRILRTLPSKGDRQTLLFSATLPDDVLRLANQWMDDPLRVEVDTEQIVAGEIEQRLYTITAHDKFALLLNILEKEKSDRVLVFCNRRIACETLHRKLHQYGVNVALMTGDVPQKKRMKVLEAFRNGRIRVIVATDVAGRGIHVENITHVINYDLPYEPENYVHRIGRTGRAGVRGQAVSFACEESAFELPAIEDYIKQPLRAERPDSNMLKLPHPKHPPAPDHQQGPSNKRRRGSRQRRQRH